MRYFGKNVGFIMTQERKVPGKGDGKAAKCGMGFGERRRIASGVIGMKMQHQ